MQTDYGSSSLSQWAAAEWFSSGLYDEHMCYIREQLKIRRNATVRSLEKHFTDIATWNFPKGDSMSGSSHSIFIDSRTF